MKVILSFLNWRKNQKWKNVWVFQFDKTELHVNRYFSNDEPRIVLSECSYLENNTMIFRYHNLWSELNDAFAFIKQNKPRFSGDPIIIFTSKWPIELPSQDFVRSMMFKCGAGKAAYKEIKFFSNTMKVREFIKKLL